MNPTTHVLRPQPPIRAFVLAAALALVGALLVVICAATSAPTFFMVVAWVLLVLGVLLLAVGLISMQRLRSFVDLTDEGYRVRTPGRVREGLWDEVTKVTSSQNGAHLTLYQGQVTRTHILAPGNIASAEMEALAADIAERLDRNRGYHQLTDADFAPSASTPTDEPGAAVDADAQPAASAQPATSAQPIADGGAVTGEVIEADADR